VTTMDTALVATKRPCPGAAFLRASPSAATPCPLISSTRTSRIEGHRLHATFSFCCILAESIIRRAGGKARVLSETGNLLQTARAAPLERYCCFPPPLLPF